MKDDPNYIVVFGCKFDTGEYSQPEPAYLDPVNKKEYSLPAFTFYSKPEIKEDKAAVIEDIEDPQSNWKYVEDYRNRDVFVKATKLKITIDYLDELKSIHTLIPPLEQFLIGYTNLDYIVWSEEDENWVENKEIKRQVLISIVEQKFREAMSIIGLTFLHMSFSNVPERDDLIKTIYDQIFELFRTNKRRIIDYTDIDKYKTDEDLDFVVDFLRVWEKETKGKLSSEELERASILLELKYARHNNKININPNNMMLTDNVTLT